MKKTRKQTTSRRCIYDQNYYKAQAMIRSPWFTEKICWLKKRFEEVGCPLPTEPFGKYYMYLDWNKKYWDRYGEMELSPEFLEAKTRITGNKETMNVEEFNALEEFRKTFLPPVYGNVFDEILEYFNIDRDDKGFRNFLEFYIFFGEKEYHVSPFMISWIRNSITDKFELFIQIYGHTKKTDIMKHWDWISHEQKDLKNFIGKNKAWKTFDRDIEIYNCYKELKNPQKKRSAGFRAIDGLVYTKLAKKYPKLTISGIRTIVSRTQKRLGEI